MHCTHCRRVATQPPTPERSGVLRRKPKKLRSTLEHSGNLQKIFRRRYLRKASGGEISTPEASGSLPEYSGVVLNQLQSPPECFFRRIPEEAKNNSGTIRRKPKTTPEHSGSLRKSFRRRYFLQASGGEFLLRKCSGVDTYNSGALRSVPEG